MDVFVVLDESGSMKPIFSRVTGFLADALVRDYLEPEDYLCIIGFSDRPRVRVSQRLSSPAEKENLADMLLGLNVVPQGYTDMGRALEETARQLERLAHPSHQQILLILTDGLNQPPRDSPYYSPVRPDSGVGLTPPSNFNERFAAQVARLAERGYRIHVVGIGADTDARNLADSLQSDYTILREFNLEELRSTLARFWDETIDLVGLDGPTQTFLPEQPAVLRARLRSTSDKDREVRLSSVRVSRLERLGSGEVPENSMIALELPTRTWLAPTRGEAVFDVGLRLAPEFPAGEFRATVAFEQESAVKFYPPEASITFKVPSFWERHGAKLLGVGALVASSGLGVFFYRRRPVPVLLVVEGEPEPAAVKPVWLKISGLVPFGGGATDRFRVSGLPQKVGHLERRAVDRFTVLSSRPELVPTVAEYSLGEPIEIRTGEGAQDRRRIRFVPFKRKPPRRRAAPSRRESLPPARQPGASGGVDFR